MDWEGIGLTAEVVAWLERTAERKATRERRLDPFATSMRDFDDVAEQLEAVSQAAELTHSDTKQRITDLRSAGLIEDPGGVVKLTDLGSAVLSGWTKWNIVNADKLDELSRTLVVYGEARRLGAMPYLDFANYWSELRAVFDPIALIDNWDALFTLNYLDHRLDGFAPGDAYRDDASPVSDIEYDLDLFAASVGASENAHVGADQVRGGIEGKIPRGRARATACLAMELMLQPAAVRDALVTRFGVPRRPREWEKLDAQRIARVLQIAASLDVGQPAPAAQPLAEAVPTAQAKSVKPAAPQAKALIDYEAARRDPPKPKPGKGGNVKGGPRKTDHKRRQERNGEVGRLGEEFALGYERWRLANRPDLADQIQQVSLEDDTLGYDIKSFEPDGSDRFVEVKATEGPLTTRFFLSSNEVAFAGACPKNYVLLRVGGLRTDPTYCELRHPFDELEFRTSVYECTFKPEHLDNCAPI